ncbi:MAG: MFS transporter [Acidimicrobiales bacterium]
MWQALRSSRDFRLLVIGELVSRAGTAASFVAVWAVAVYELGVGPVGLSVLALCNTLPRVLTSAIAGRLVDRYDPRAVLLVANVVGALGSVLQWASPNAVLFGLATLVAGASFGAFLPAMQSMSPRVVEDRELHGANALLELTWQIGFIVGPLAGVAAIAVGGNRGPLLFDAATFVVGVGCLLPVRLLPVRDHVSGRFADSPGDDLAGVDATGRSGPEAAAADPTSPVGAAAGADGEPGRGFVANLRYAWSVPVARFVLLLNTGSWLGIAFFIVLEPLYVADVLGAGPEVLGLLQTAFGLGAIAGAAVAARLEARVGPRLLAATMVLCGGGMIGYTVSDVVGVAAAGVTVWGVGIGLWAPVSRTMIQRGVPMANHGRVNGVMSTLQSALEVLPVLAAGQLAVLVGIQATLIAAGLSTLALAVWGLRRSRTVGVPLVAADTVVPRWH